MIAIQFKVKLVTVTDAVLFAATCNEYEEDIDYYYNRYIVDAKSLVGILGVGLGKECNVELHSDNTELIKRFWNDIEMWRVG